MHQTMPHNILVSFLIFAITYKDITSTLVGTPLNTAVIQGSAVTLQCSSNVNSSFIPWYNSLCVTTDRSVGDCTDDLIHTGHLRARDVPARFSVTKVNSATHVTRDLNINRTQLTDAGVYLCAERRTGVGGVTDSSSAQLIVLGDMRCTSNVSASGAVQENDVIMMTCSVTYSGNWAPVMRWFNSSHNFTDDSTTLPASNTTVTSQLTITASAALHGSQIVCATYFTQSSRRLSTSAANVPSYTDTWMSPAFNIEYAPRNLQIKPNRSTYQRGVRILCSAEGNPEPSYQWTDLVSGTVIQGAVLVIMEDMTNKSHSFQCTASNQYNSISFTLRFTVEASTSSGNNIALIAGVVGGVALLLIIVIVIIVVICPRKRRKAAKNSDVEDRRLPNVSGETTPSRGRIDDGAYENIDIHDMNGHSSRRPTPDQNATSMHDSPEPTYGEVISQPGPVARPRASQIRNQTEAQDPTYAAIVHNKQ